MLSTFSDEPTTPTHRVALDDSLSTRSSPVSSTAVRSKRSPLRVVMPGGTTWAENFDIPWKNLNRSLIKACEDKVRPTKADQLHFVKILGDRIFQEVKRPGKQNLEIISRRVVSKYPKTFQDDVPGLGVLGDGLETMRRRLVNYIDNKNRQPSQSLRKQIYEQEIDSENGPTRKRKASSSFLKDSFGCINWQPSGFPQGETTDTQEEHRIWLSDEYTKDFQEVKKVKDLMGITYASQRLLINKSAENDTKLSDVLQQWPYLRKPLFLLDHFEELMGFNLVKTFDEQYKKKSQEILDFAISQGKGKAHQKGQELLSICEELKTEMPKLCGALLLLPFLLNETGGYEKIFSFRDVSTQNQIN